MYNALINYMFNLGLSINNLTLPKKIKNRYLPVTSNETLVTGHSKFTNISFCFAHKISHVIYLMVVILML